MLRRSRWLAPGLLLLLLAGADSSDFDDNDDGDVAAPAAGDMQTSVTIEVQREPPRAHREHGAAAVCGYAV